MKMLVKISATLVLGLLCMGPGFSQNGKKQIQIKIIENGKVKTDTTFVVNKDVDKSDIDQISKILNDEDVVFFNEHPGRHKFVYEFNQMPNLKMNDSLFHLERRIFAPNDSIFERMHQHMMNDSMLSFHFKQGEEFFKDEFPRDHDNMMPLHKYYYKDLSTPDKIEKDTLVDDDIDLELNEGNTVIIEKNGKGQKKIIIEKHSQPEKIIRKKLDDDTEIIIIKKDYEKNKPKKEK